MKKDKTIDEVVKDGVRKNTWLRYPVAQERKRQGTLYAELREDQINKLMLLQATASTGDTEHVTAGDPIDDFVVQIHQNPRRPHFPDGSQLAVSRFAEHAAGKSRAPVRSRTQVSSPTK